MKGVDGHMNIQLEDVVLTAKDGSRFFHLKEVFIRGNCLKYFRMADEVLQGLEGTQYVMPKWKSGDKKKKKERR